MAVNRRKARHRAPPGGKFLLVGPDWNGQKPEGFGFAFHHLLLPALSLQRCVLLAPRRLMFRADINRTCGALIRKESNYTTRYTIASARTKFSQCHSHLVWGPSSPLDRTNPEQVIRS